MVERRKKKRKKLLGHRTHGKGNTKNKRGAGCRGGRGKAGSKKHKRMKFGHLFGTKVRLKTKQKKLRLPEKKAINLADLAGLLERLEAEKRLEKEKGLVVLDGARIGFQKILGRGKPPEKLLFRNLQLSRKALEKVKQAQGLVELKVKKEAEKKPEEARKIEEVKAKEEKEEKGVRE